MATKHFPYGRLQPSYKAENKFLSEITYDILDDRKPVLHVTRKAIRMKNPSKFNSLGACQGESGLGTKFVVQE
jgi:hypothetical protein